MTKNVIVRTYSAGCFYGQMVRRAGKEVVLKNARRLWMWSGAASLSQLAQTGTSNPGGCKFPEKVAGLVVTEAIEIISMTPAAVKNLDAVPTWKV